MDTLANMFTQIINAQRVSKKQVIVPFSKLKENIAKILKSENYIKNYKKISRNSKDYLQIFINYKNGKAAISEIKRISKPGRRVYVTNKKINHVLRGYGISIISTPKGIMTNKNAKNKGFGGELMCEIW